MNRMDRMCQFRICDCRLPILDWRLPIADAGRETTEGAESTEEGKGVTTKDTKSTKGAEGSNWMNVKIREGEEVGLFGPFWRLDSGGNALKEKEMREVDLL